MGHELGDLPSSSHYYSARSTLHSPRLFAAALGAQSRRPPPPISGGRGFARASRGWAAAVKPGPPLHSQASRPPAPRVQREEARAGGQSQRRNPFSPEAMTSKSMLWLLGNSPLCDSEATQSNRVSMTIIIEVLGLALPPSAPTFPRTENPGVTCAPLGRTDAGSGARSPAPSSPGLAARLRQNLQVPRLCAVAEGSAGSEQAQASPAQAQAGPRPGPPSCARHRGGRRVSTAQDPGSRRAPDARGAGTAST